ncbi:MAG: hypothetical protein G01um101424_234 [Parcubacteria group bacterium Gr01-1014_24]|nr:MAG: hypothetical protein G01um101424_234 [Parcubacteria group bacterium Gr01-1014_24]
METQTNTSINSVPRTSAKDFFINLGAIVALGVFVGNLISLLFTVINKAYPITTGYNYHGSYSISWPVATLIITFPIYILLMWLLERAYTKEPEKRYIGIRKWLTYITLFLAGLATAGDLITVLYYFIDGQEMTTGFIMKVLSVLVVALAVFFYYISDVMGKLNSMSRKVWVFASFIIILGSIVWGFFVLGSPRTQQLLKYDQQKVSHLQGISNQITNFYVTKGMLPQTLTEMSSTDYYITQVDSQNGKPYEYEKTGDTTYNLCAEFNKASDDKMSQAYPYVNTMMPYGGTSTSWMHPAGKHCFNKTINPNMYSKPTPFR